MNIGKISSNKLFYFLLSLLLIAAFFIRIYKVGQVLGFYFDQGRDALVVWDLIHSHKFFLIGPTTGIAGIFRGPFYYYLIAPFYFLGQGDPVWPSIFLAFTSVLAIGLGAYLTSKISGKSGAIIFSLLSGASFYIILASRWLSNPTPMLLLSMLLLWGMFLVIEGKAWAWVFIAFIAGCSLFHFGSSGEFFYIPALAVFFTWQRKISLKVAVLSLIVFLLTAAPLVFFDFRHDRILTHNLLEFLFGKESFKGSFWNVLPERLSFYYTVFSSKIFETRNNREILLMFVPAAALILNLPKLIKNKYFLSVVILFLTPLVGLLFFQGNEGNIYDYYLTGYYLVFLIIFSIGLSLLVKNNLGKVFAILFFSIFLVSNLNITFSRLSDGGDGPNTIIFSNQKKALDWVYEDSNGLAFNVDVYVPPVIPYAYDYLFTWYDSKRHLLVKDSQISLLYTLYEEDPPHPERLDAWLARQKGIGKVLREQKFGGITVQRRERIK